MVDFNYIRVVFRVFRVGKSSGHTFRTIGTQDHVLLASRAGTEELEIPYFSYLSLRLTYTIDIRVNIWSFWIKESIGHGDNYHSVKGGGEVPPRARAREGERESWGGGQTF